MKRVLVTGATGFIGRYLLQYLLEDPDIQITAIDNLSNSRADDFDLLLDPRVKFIECSVQEYTDLPGDTELDEIWHLASPVGPVGVLRYPGTMGPMIVQDTALMADLALRTGAKLMDISTSEVYGKDPAGVPQVEDLDKTVPSNITIRLEYGVAKLLCEIFLTNLTRTTELKCNMVRPYNIISYGQQASAGFVLPRFLEQATRGDSITLYPPGTQRRTFTDVRDFVEGMLAVMKKGKNGEIYNIGNPANLHTIREFAEAIVKATDSTSEIVLTDPKKLHGKLFEEAWEKIPNIDKVTEDTGWKPTRTLDDIISHAIKRINDL